MLPRVTDEPPAGGTDCIVRSRVRRDNGRSLTPDQPVVVVLGPTATGKTALAVRLAAGYNGEVVNADSRYLYRGMDIGTAKPTQAEMAGVPHHLIDVLSPLDDYSLARFLDDAFAAVEDVARRGRLPVVAGGTPQYLRGFIDGWQAPEVAPQPELRAQLDREATEALFQRLLVVDPAAAERTGPDNKRRIIRALEIYLVSGERMSDLQGSVPPPYRMHILGLRQPRDVLHARIDARVRAMFSAGWLDEVARLRALGVDAKTPAMSAHGYREALAVLDGTLTLDDAILQTCVMVHRYVRHQETWFRKFPNVHWYDSSVVGFDQVAFEDVGRFLETSPG